MTNFYRASLHMMTAQNYDVMSEYTVFISRSNFKPDLKICVKRFHHVISVIIHFEPCQFSWEQFYYALFLHISILRKIQQRSQQQSINRVLSTDWVWYSLIFNISFNRYEQTLESSFQLNSLYIEYPVTVYFVMNIAPHCRHFHCRFHTARYVLSSK